MPYTGRIGIDQRFHSLEDSWHRTRASERVEARNASRIGLTILAYDTVGQSVGESRKWVPRSYVVFVESALLACVDKRSAMAKFFVNTQELQHLIDGLERLREESIILTAKIDQALRSSVWRGSNPPIVDAEVFEAVQLFSAGGDKLEWLITYLRQLRTAYEEADSEIEARFGRD
jgi:hypothetical protein